MTESVKLTIKFHCPCSRVHEALTDQRDTMMAIQGPAKVEARPGGAYEIFGGSIQGTFTEVAPQRIVMQWRMSTWAAGVHSTVTISLTPRGDSGCAVELAQEGIPSTDAFGNGGIARQVEAGWRERIFGGMGRFIGLPIDKDDD